MKIETITLTVRNSIGVEIGELSLHNRPNVARTFSATLRFAAHSERLTFPVSLKIDLTAKTVKPFIVLALGDEHVFDRAHNFTPRTKESDMSQGLTGRIDADSNWDAFVAAALPKSLRAPDNEQRLGSHVTYWWKVGRSASGLDIAIGFTVTRKEWLVDHDGGVADKISDVRRAIGRARKEWPESKIWGLGYEKLPDAGK